MAKSRRTSDLSVEKPEVARVLVGAVIDQADRWIQQLDGLVGGGSYGHLRRSTPICSRGDKWGQGVRARQQLMENGYTVLREAEWVRVILQQYGGGNTELARLVPWDLQIELKKYSKSNREPD